MGANSVQDWKQGLSHPLQLLPCNLAPGVPGHLVLMLPWSVVWTAASAVLASLHRGCACLRYATVGMVPPPVSLRFRCAWGEVKWVEVMPVALASAGSLGPVLVYLLGAPRAPHADPGPGWVLSSVSPGGGADAGEVVLAADSTRESRDFLGTIVAEIQVLHQESNHLLHHPHFSIDTKSSGTRGQWT